MLESGIYEILCVPEGTRYIGYATSLEHRLDFHLRKLRTGKHKNRSMQAAFNKYKEPNFKFSVLEKCPKEQLVLREKWWLITKKSYLPEFGFNLKKAGKKSFTHGMTHSTTFKSWDTMIQRCTNKNAKGYEGWGGSGIIICERWLTSFESFLADMGERPPGTTLDRYPNKRGNYEPENCRWATPKEQQRNKTNNRFITYNGETKLLIVWAEEINIPYDLLLKRVNAGMVGDQLFAPSYSSFTGLIKEDGTTPKRRHLPSAKTQKFTAFGKTLSLTEWAIELGISRDLLSQRILRRKTPLEKALTRASLKRGKVGPRKGHKMITAFGKTQSLTCWAREYKLPVPTLKNRLYRAKMLPETALTAQLYAKQRRIDHT